MDGSPLGAVARAGTLLSSRTHSDLEMEQLSSKRLLPSGECSDLRSVQASRVKENGLFSGREG